MLRINECKSAAGAKRYYTALSQSDYYLNGEEIAGSWGGKLAEKFGLSGEVTREEFGRLCDGEDPTTGESLLTRQKDTRRVGYDWTFSAPKSVSALWELSGDDRILTAFQDAVGQTMAEAEAEMKTRVRKGGKNEDRVVGNMAWAAFTHTTTRPVDGVPDPHLHQHVFAFSLVRDETEGIYKAGQFGDLKRDAPYFEAAFNARLAGKLEGLGYATERDGSMSFRVAAVPQSVEKKFSRRTEEIEAKAKELGITDAKAKDRLGERTRKRKDAGVQLIKRELRKKWWERLDATEQAAMRAIKKEGKHGGGHGGGPGVSGPDAMAYAVDHVFERASVVPEKRLKEAALRYGVGSVSPEEIDALAKRENILTREVRGERVSTTKDVLREESEMLRIAREGRGQFRPLGKSRDLEGLEGEQKKAALQVLNSRDRVIGLRGGAGTGKTTMMKGTIAAIEKGTMDGGAPEKVFVFAPSASASRGVLRDEGFKDADTVARFLQDEKLQLQTRGATIWVDEAGLLSSRAMNKLLTLAERNNNRIVLSGDKRQHAGIERGDALRLLETESGIPFAELKEVRRQKDRGYRKAVERISEGTAEGVAAGFDQLDKMGWVTEAQGSKRHEQLVADYLDAVDSGKSALVIAPTHKEGDRLTVRIRESLKERGMVKGDDRTFTVIEASNWTEAQRRDAHLYQAGQVVEFHQNVKGGFQRGDRVTVQGNTGGAVTVERADGNRTTLPLSESRQFQVYDRRDLQLAKGDRIRITQNGVLQGGTKAESKGARATMQRSRMRLNNGAVYSVEGFTKSGDIKLSNGWTLPKNHGHLDSAYVDTSQASQGKTVDCVFIAVGSESLRPANAQQFYVSASRARESAQLYVSSKQDVREAIQRSGVRMSATELVRPNKMERFIIERKRVTDYLKQRAQEAIKAVRQGMQRRREIEYGR